MTSELVSNAVRHAGTAVAVLLEWEDPRLRIEVVDGSPELPSFSPDPGAGGGFGLWIVARFATAWGAERREGGKSVWLTLARGD